LIELISPHILVKGGDYNIANIVGADHVLKNGGEVKVLNFEPGLSSSGILAAIEE
jgi:D-beta-D-heptose 7-phosphate kinase/D-beta-D-heptose 1-phosphate adenosyltransferase